MLSTIEDIMLSHEKDWREKHLGMDYPGMELEYITEEVNKKLNIFWFWFTQTFYMNCLPEKEIGWESEK